MVKNMPANAGDTRDAGSIPGSKKSSENPHTVLLLRKFLGQSLAGYSPWGRKESDMIKHMHTAESVTSFEVG